MTALIQDKFGGLAPKIDPRRLSPELAQIAVNCVFEEHTLRPLRYPTTLGVDLMAGTKVVYNYRGEWLQFSYSETSVVPSPVVNDVFNRIYYTDATYPKVRSGAGVYRLGLSRPGTPTVQAESIPDDPDNLLQLETIYYVITAVDSFGAEGPPSPPTMGVTRVRNTPVTVTFTTKPAGDYNLGAGAKLRVYRSNTGTKATIFQFAGEVPFTALGFTDNVLNEELQEGLPSGTWTGPPDDDTTMWPDGPLQGLEFGPNGILSGYVDRTLYFSEPYLPHAWPTEYSITVRDKILNTVWVSAGLLVVTTGQPLIITGAHPASLTVFIPERWWRCISGRSLVDMGGWAIYQSADGLVGVHGLEFVLLTEALYDNNRWLSHIPKRSIGGNSEGRYVLFWDNAVGVKGAIIFDPMMQKNAITTADFYSDIAHHNAINGQLLVRDENNTLASFDTAGGMKYTWRSKIHQFTQPANFAYLEVIANEYPVRVRLMAGDHWGQLSTVVFDKNVQERLCALPSGFEYDHWTIEVSDDRELVSIALYEDLSEVG